MSDAVDPTFVANAVGIRTTFQDLGGGSARFLPQRIAVLGQGTEAATYAADPLTLTGGAAEAASVYGFGSPIHLAVSQLLPANADGVGSIPVTVYPLVSGTTEAADTITPSGTVTKDGVYFAIIGGQRTPNFTVLTGAAVADVTASLTAAITATLNSPMAASDNTTAVGLLCKWKGETGNDIVTEIVGPSDTGAVWGIAGAASGAGNPTVDSALALFNDTWETMVVNCLNTTDTTALDALATHNEGRWGPLVKKPYIAVVGEPEATAATMISFGDGRRLDRTTSAQGVPGSDDLPCMIAARTVARRSVTAQLSPARDAIRQTIASIRPGLASEQFDANGRDQLVKAGIATSELRDGAVALSEGVMLYHPTGDPLPAYRHIATITRLQTIIYNLGLIFDADEWAGAPLVPDGQAVTESSARSPSDAKAAIFALLDNLSEAAIISDAAFSKGAMTVAISGTNPNRLDIVLPVKLSGNSFVKSINLNFGFFFGG